MKGDALLYNLIFIIIGFIILYVCKNKKILLKKNSELKKERTELSGQIFNLNKKITLLDKEIEEKNNFNSSLYKIREEELERLVESQKEQLIKQINKEVEEWAMSAQEAATFERDKLLSEYRVEEYKARDELLKVICDLNDYKKQRDVVNAEILRSRAIEEKQDFYRIQIDENAKHDIEIINSIRPQIYKFETLNKLLYDNYISKPTKEMVKRVLEGKNPSGIYKVTNIKTKEAYIGKSTTVGDRWVNHVKSACGLEGVADSQFQRALKKYGIDEFVWELLEVVPKDKLTEREKYWISFYDTLKYGYNMRIG